MYSIELFVISNQHEYLDFIILGFQTSDTDVRYSISFSNDQNYDQVCTQLNFL